MVDMERKKSMIDSIIIHCSDSDLDEFDNIEAVRQWHLDRGWSDIGYHFYIDSKGKMELGRPIEKAGAHCAGHNLRSIGICISGRKRFYSEQYLALLFLLKDLMRRYKLKRSDVYPHNYFNSNKSCPNFSIETIWSYEHEK